MTRRMADQARHHLPEGVDLIARTNSGGPVSIQGAADGVAALPGTLRLLEQTTFDVAVIGCFDDTGLFEMWSSQTKPVIGLGHAAFLNADRIGRGWGVLTTSPLSVPVLNRNLHAYRLTKRCRTIRASNIDVLDFETDRSGATQRLIAAGSSLLEDHPDIETVVLGCAGMGGLAETIETALGVRIVDPVVAAVQQALADGV